MGLYFYRGVLVTSLAIRPNAKWIINVTRIPRGNIGTQCTLHQLSISLVPIHIDFGAISTKQCFYLKQEEVIENNMHNTGLHCLIAVKIKKLCNFVVKKTDIKKDFLA